MADHDHHQAIACPFFVVFYRSCWIKRMVHGRMVPWHSYCLYRRCWWQYVAVDDSSDSFSPVDNWMTSMTMMIENTYLTILVYHPNSDDAQDMYTCIYVKWTNPNKPRVWCTRTHLHWSYQQSSDLLSYSYLAYSQYTLRLPAHFWSILTCALLVFVCVCVCVCDRESFSFWAPIGAPTNTMAHTHTHTHKYWTKLAFMHIQQVSIYVNEKTRMGQETPVSLSSLAIR